MKMFINQPMSIYTFEEVVNNRQNFIKLISDIEEYKDVEIIDNLCEFDINAEESPNPSIYYLGNDLKALANADIAFFANNWEDARGCVIEHTVCEKYGIKTIYEKDLERLLF